MQPKIVAIGESFVEIMLLVHDVLFLMMMMIKIEMMMNGEHVLVMFSNKKWPRLARLGA